MEIGFVSKRIEPWWPPELKNKWGEHTMKVVSKFIKSCRCQYATKQWLERAFKDCTQHMKKESAAELFDDLWSIFQQNHKVKFVADKYMMLRAYNVADPRLDLFIRYFGALVEKYEFDMTSVPEMTRRVLNSMTNPPEEEYALYTVSKMLIRCKSDPAPPTERRLTRFNVALYRLTAVFNPRVVFVMGEDRVPAVVQIKDKLGYRKVSATAWIPEIAESCRDPEAAGESSQPPPPFHVIAKEIVRRIWDDLTHGDKLAVELPDLHPAMLDLILSAFYNKHNRARKDSASCIGVLIYAGAPTSDRFEKMFTYFDENNVFIPFEVAGR
jgi:hypothetical protein